MWYVEMVTWWERLRRRRQLRAEAEEERIERIEARRAAWRERESTSSIASVATALGSALDRTFQIESKLLEQMGGFLSVLEEASAKRAAQVLGSRGGTRRALNQRAKRLEGPKCPLCIDPLRRDVTVAMITAHQTHLQTQPNGSAQ